MHACVYTTEEIKLIIQKKKKIILEASIHGINKKKEDERFIILIFISVEIS